MRVLLEVAIHAVHPFFEMDILQVNGFLEAVRIFERDRFVGGVEPRALAIVLVDRPVDPAVSVEIRELRLLQLAD